MLVSLERAKAHLRITHTADDADIEQKVEEASAAVIAYLDTYADRFLDTSGNIIEVLVPFQVAAATLILVHALYRDRGSQSEEVWRDANYLPRAVVALLYPLRTPVVAI